MAHYLPSLVVPPIVSRLRQETQNVILPGEEEDLRRYLEERRRAGMRLNLNQLGEAILGEAEAARRLDAYLALLARDGLTSGIHTLDDREIARWVDRDCQSLWSGPGACP